MDERTTSVVIIDDDPMHLRIYGWIIGEAGYEPLPALVTGDRIDFPEKPAQIVVMDYRLSDRMTAVQAAEMVRLRYPGAPILVLSDVYDLPEDIALYAQAFVRKGEPAKLVEVLKELCRNRAEMPDHAA
jgi:DNA-binding NarL/FixJ family response regulator